MDKKIFEFGVSSLLNKPKFHSTAAIAIKISLDYNFPSGHLYISDCTRTISLNLDFDSEEEMDNSLFKLNKIVDVCNAAIKNIEGNRNNYLEAIKKYEEKYKSKEDNEQTSI